MRPFASTDLVHRLAPITAAARAAGIPAQISEANSVACGGKAGVSDTPASALWALSVLGSAAATGFGRIQFHSAERTYDAFVVRPDGGVNVLDPVQRTRPRRPTVARWNRATPAVRSLPAARRGRLGGAPPRRPVALIAVNDDQEHAHHLELISPASNARYGRLEAAGAHAVTLDGRRLACGPTIAGVARDAQDSACWRSGQARTLVLPAASAAWALLKPEQLPMAAERSTNDE